MDPLRPWWMLVLARATLGRPAGGQRQNAGATHLADWTGSVLLVGALVWGTFHQRLCPTLAIFGILATPRVIPAAGGGNVYTPEQFPIRMRAWATGTSATWVRGTAVIMPILVATIATSRLGVTGVWWISAIPPLFGGLWVARFGIETKA